MGEACSEKNRLKWWGFTSTCKRLQETQLWISIHSRPTPQDAAVQELAKHQGYPSSNMACWKILEVNGGFQ